ncbi:hypothetical protein NQ317_018474 [Molorchus minor]|uniref:Transformer n=1 Tax=Molorchus minor TaxID=1323400 RepID=A0ABQ9J333_9CUCU|nr:hypothetical protein NQ317_018474 [Molorchus minor]
MLRFMYRCSPIAETIPSSKRSWSKRPSSTTRGVIVVSSWTPEPKFGSPWPSGQPYNDRKSLGYTQRGRRQISLGLITLLNKKSRLVYSVRRSDAPGLNAFFNYPHSLLSFRGCVDEKDNNNKLLFANPSLGNKTIFDREDVLVNQEERFVLSDANSLEGTKLPTRLIRPRRYSRSRSRSPSRGSVSPSYRRSSSTSRSRSDRQSLDKDKRHVSDRGTEKRKSLEKDRDKRGLERRRSLDRDKERKPNDRRERSTEGDRERKTGDSRGGQYSREREDERYRRSRTPLRPGEYRPPRSETRRRSRSRERDLTHEKYSSSRRSRSASKDRSRKIVRSPGEPRPSTSRKPSRSPSRSKDRPKSPRYRDTSRGRRSRSPSKREKPFYGREREQDKSPRYRSSERRRSRSPLGRRKSRSPHRSLETARGRSSPAKYDRYSIKHSHSPGRHEAEVNRVTGVQAGLQSMIGVISKSDKYRRSRSRSPRKHRGRSPPREHNAEFAYYEGIPGSEYWIPGPIRPGFPIPRFYPPAFYPRMPGAPIIIPPQNSNDGALSPRLPVYNSKLRPKVTQAESGVIKHPQQAAQMQIPQGVLVIAGGIKNEESEKRIVEEESIDCLHEKD